FELTPNRRFKKFKQKIFKKKSSTVFDRSISQTSAHASRSSRWEQTFCHKLKKFIHRLSPSQ
ncbi:hypothetical protein, partial [Lacticaseibacillus paracasei]|uniref:hypothetical protein n=1 Tax=Lacticaseibacillus paracasei TaxID=1597 RepID=UPI001CDBF3A2